MHKARDLVRILKKTAKPWPKHAYAMATIYFLTHVDCQSLVNCWAASRRDAISVTPYVVWGMCITLRYDGRRYPTLRYARIG